MLPASSQLRPRDRQARRARSLAAQARRCRKGHRLLWAAQTSLAAGRSQAALAFVERAQPLVQDQVYASELDVVRAAVSMREGSPDQTFSPARSAALALGQREAERAVEMVSLMIWAAATGGWASRVLPDAHATLAQISGGGARRELCRRCSTVRWRCCAATSCAPATCSRTPLRKPTLSAAETPVR